MVFILPFLIKISPVVNNAAWRNLCRPREMAGWSIYADIYDPSMSCEKLQHTKEVRCLYSQQPLPILHGQNRHESWVVSSPWAFPLSATIAEGSNMWKTRTPSWHPLPAWDGLGSNSPLCCRARSSVQVEGCSGDSGISANSINT